MLSVVRGAGLLSLLSFPPRLLLLGVPPSRVLFFLLAVLLAWRALLLLVLLVLRVLLVPLFLLVSLVLLPLLLLKALLLLLFVLLPLEGLLLLSAELLPSALPLLLVEVCPILEGHARTTVTWRSGTWPSEAVPEWASGVVGGGGASVVSVSGAICGALVAGAGSHV